MDAVEIGYRRSVCDMLQLLNAVRSAIGGGCASQPGPALRNPLRSPFQPPFQAGAGIRFRRFLRSRGFPGARSDAFGLAEGGTATGRVLLL